MSPMGSRALTAVMCALASTASACTVATVGEGTETSRAALATAAAAVGAGEEAGATLACGVRFVNAATGSGSTTAACRSPGQACRTIQQAVGVACPGDVVIVGAGRFVENVVIDKPLSVIGSGDGTVVFPAASSPAPCVDSSVCGGAASSVVLVRANDVTIADLSIDGDNPALSSGVVVRGADVDARNGIMTDVGGPFDGLQVHNVTVRNVYLRGIDASSGGTFVIEESRVINVSGDPQAAGIFDTEGGGVIDGNVVVDAGTGIAANRSRGTRITNNTVTRSAGGIHTDNAGLAPGSSPDVVANNVVTDCGADGFGVWSFAPYLPATFRGNRVSRCGVGLAELGQNAPARAVFVDNQVDGASLPGTIGLYVTTSLFDYGSSDVRVVAARNTIANTSVGVYVDEQTGHSATVDLDCDALPGDAEAIVSGDASVTVHDRAACTAVAEALN